MKHNLPTKRILGNFEEDSVVDEEGNLYYFKNGLWKLNLMEEKSKKQRLLGDMYGSNIIRQLVYRDGFLYCWDETAETIDKYDAKNDRVATLIGTHEFFPVHYPNLRSIRAFTVDNYGDLYFVEYLAIAKTNFKKGIVEMITTTYTKVGHQHYALVGIEVTSNGTIIVIEGKNICTIDIRNVSTWTSCKSTYFAVDSDSILLLKCCLQRMNVQHGKSTSKWITNFSLTSSGGLTKQTCCGITLLDLVWKVERCLWIGFLKEHSEHCPLARLPKNLVREIASYVRFLGTK